MAALFLTPEVINMTFEQNLFTEFREVLLEDSQEKITDEALIKAVTMNENLITETGYVFDSESLAKIAQGDRSAEIYSKVKSFVPEVKAKPMYPDFPSAVMEMEEAEYRLHQYMHYFSTYGMEFLFGVDIHKGWLPVENDMAESTEKTEKDDLLLQAKTLKVISPEGIYADVYRRIMARRERFTEPEKELVREAVIQDSACIRGVQVSFKENLIPVFAVMMESLQGEERKEALREIVQNAGDVLTCARSYIAGKDYHLRTSEKRVIVQLLESFTPGDLRNNLILSRKKREQSLLVLQYLDYNVYSRSEEHRNCVNKLRDGELYSWESSLKKELAKNPEAGLSKAAERPGELLRKCAYLIRNGVEPAEIGEVLIRHADALSIQTLVTVCRRFAGKHSEEAAKEKEYRYLEVIFTEVLYAALCGLNTPLKGKKIYTEEGAYSFAYSFVEASDKSAEGGYMRSGMAYKIPEDVRYVRFFTYWNDEKRIDIDLHAYASDEKGENRVHVGWDDEFKSKGLVMSGDVTHSNAAEYLDADLEKTVENGLTQAVFRIHSFTGVPFSKIETVLTGMMAVSKLGVKKSAKLYDPANCFFSHLLRTEKNQLLYGKLDMKHRVLVYLGKDIQGYVDQPLNEESFSLRRYLDLLYKAQGVTEVSTPEDAEIILRADKPQADNEISLIEQNFFMDR